MCMYLCNEECNVNHVLQVYTYATKNVKESCDYYATTKACPAPPGTRLSPSFSARVQRSRNNCAAQGGEPGNEATILALWEN